MLEQLFGSKARAQLLQFIFSKKLPAYTIVEAAQQTGIPVSALQKEWDLFIAMGIIKQVQVKEEDSKKQKKKKSNENIFCLNEKFVFFRELQNLVLKAKIFLNQEFAKKILELGDIKLFLLSGIFLEQRDITQTDMLVVGKINRFKIKSAIKKYEKELGIELFYTILSEKEYKYRLSIADYFLYNILENKAIVVADELDYDSIYKYNH